MPDNDRTYHGTRFVSSAICWQLEASIEVASKTNKNNADGLYLLAQGCGGTRKEGLSGIGL